MKGNEGGGVCRGIWTIPGIGGEKKDCFQGFKHGIRRFKGGVGKCGLLCSGRCYNMSYGTPFTEPGDGIKRSEKLPSSCDRS